MKNYSVNDLTLLLTVQRLQKFTRHLQITKAPIPGFSHSWILFESVMVVDQKGRLRVFYKKVS